MTHCAVSHKGYGSTITLQADDKDTTYMCVLNQTVLTHRLIDLCNEILTPVFKKSGINKYKCKSSIPAETLSQE